MDTSPLEGQTFRLTDLLDALPLDSWVQLDRMFSVIEQALRDYRPITKQRTLARRTGMSSSAFSKLRRRVRDRLGTVLPGAEDVLDADLLPTERGIRVKALAAEIVRLVQHTQLGISSDEANGPGIKPDASSD